jgi:hypothetical protein
MIVDTVWLTLSQYIVTFFRAVAAARRLSSVGSYFCTWAGVNGAIPPPNTIRFGWKDTTGLIPVNDQLIAIPIKPHRPLRLLVWNLRRLITTS